MTNLGSANLTILLRKAGGGFEQEAGSPIAVGTTPAGIAAADLNGDGRPDLAVANFGSHTISLLLRQPSGGFAPAAGSPIAAGLRPLGVATADFNRDGLLDLVITNNNGAASAVTVLLRQAGGGFAQDPSSPVPTASGAYGIGIADFNADGRADLAISNDGSSNITILLNTTPEPVPPTPPVVVTQTQTPPPVVAAAKPALPVISARLTLSWSVTAKAVTINSAILRDVPVGASVRLVCGSCKLRQTLTAKKAGGLTLSALRGRKFRRGSSFSLTITKPGYVGQVLARKVKSYGRSDAAIRNAARGPFSETRREHSLNRAVQGTVQGRRHRRARGGRARSADASPLPVVPCCSDLAHIPALGRARRARRDVRPRHDVGPRRPRRLAHRRQRPLERARRTRRRPLPRRRAHAGRPGRGRALHRRR